MVKRKPSKMPHELEIPERWRTIMAKPIRVFSNTSPFRQTYCFVDQLGRVIGQLELRLDRFSTQAFDEDSKAWRNMLKVMVRRMEELVEENEYRESSSIRTG